MFDFKDKNILITGGSSGLGEALIEQLHQSCNRIFNLDKEITNSSFSNCTNYKLDITKFDDLLPILTEITKNQKIDVVILNAGTTGIYPIGLGTISDNLKILQTNYTANLFLTSFFADYMRVQNEGVICAISSIGVGRGIAGVSGYFSSKSALSVLMESLRLELKKTNIKTLVVHPGFIQTKMATEEKIKHSFVLSASDAAKIIVKAIEKGKEDIRFPFAMRFFTFLSKMLPAKIYDQIISITTKS